MRFLSHRGGYRKNPAALSVITNKQNAVAITGVTVGLVVGIKGGSMLYGKLPASFRRFAGILGFAAGSIIAAKVKNDLVKKAGVGIAVSGIYDLVSQNVKAANLMPIAGIDLSYSGETINDRYHGNVQLVGDDNDVAGDTISMRGDMVDLVGEDVDGESIYA